MSLFASRVFETTAITGTGSFVLLGAQSDARGYADAYADGSVVDYFCQNEAGDIWEEGYGTLDTTAGTITRNVLDSSTGSKINWGSGTKYIFVQPSAKIMASMAAGNLASSRPGWLPAGGIWSDSVNGLIKRYTGSADVALLPFALGTAGQVLTVNSGATAPEWATPAAGLKPGSASELTIASGAVTVTGGHHSIRNQGGAAADNLDTIDASALSEGELLVLKAGDAGEVPTLRSGQDNITLSGGNCALDDTDKRIVLQKVGSNLVEVARSAATAPQIIHVREEQTSGTAGGASSATTWHTRVLNTVVTNTIPGASLATNQITLPPGTYEVFARAPAYRCQGHRCGLYSTDATDFVALGASAYTIDSSGLQSDSLLSWERFTLASENDLELRHYITVAQASNGLGVAVSSGEVEIYSEVIIRKLD